MQEPVLWSIENRTSENVAVLTVTSLPFSQRTHNTDNRRGPGSAPGSICCHQESLHHLPEGGWPWWPLPIWGGHPGYNWQNQGWPRDECGHHYHAAHPALPATPVRKPQPRFAGETLSCGPKTFKREARLRGPRDLQAGSCVGDPNTYRCKARLWGHWGLQERVLGCGIWHLEVRTWDWATLRFVNDWR